MNAESREEVFASLRQKGIKAIKVVAADGSKANGEIRGVRKRIVVLIALLAATIVGVIVHFSARPQNTTIARTFVTAKPLDRQEIAGDRLRIENAPDYLFASPVERFLSKFAEPGVRVTLRASDIPTSENFIAAINTPTEYGNEELSEYIDLMRIVAELKAEAKRYLQGGGTVEMYIRELQQRQQMEFNKKEKASKRLSDMLNSADKQSLKLAYDYFLKANAQLQSMGIAPLKMPYELINYQSTLDLE